MSTDDMIKYPLDENWQRESQSCGTMDSGCHAWVIMFYTIVFNANDKQRWFERDFFEMDWTRSGELGSVA